MNKTSLLIKGLLALLLIVVLITIYIPQSIYFAQREYFPDYLINLIQPAIFYGLLAVCLSLMVLILTPQKLLKFIVSVLLLFSLVLWVAVDFFGVSYGVLDGSAINFSHFDQRGMLELVIYGVALLVALFFHKFVLKQLPFLNMMVLLGLLAVTSFNVINEPKDKELIGEVDEEFFKYSPNKNVILIVLDTFGSDYFQQIIQSNPNITNDYSGFVSYTDAISNYPATKGSVPSFLMGEMIPDNIKYRKYLVDHLNPKGLPKVMSDNGYLVSVISVYRWFKDIFPERYMHQPKVSQDDLTAFFGMKILDFSLFRTVPHVFKPIIYNEGLWYLSEDAAVETEVPNTFPERGAALMEMMTENAIVDVERPDPRFKMIHVTIPHPQYVYDSVCSKMISNKGLAVKYLMSQQSECALKLLDDLLDKYKELGIYDKSLIVVTSDHGSRVLSDRSLTGFPSYFEMNTSGIMFMIKGVQQTGAFRQVDNPFSLMKLKEALEDESLHSTSYDYLTDESRQFYAFRNNHKAASGYIQDAPVFVVDADFSQAESWQLKRFAVNNCKAKKLPLKMTFSKAVREGYCSLYGFTDPDGKSKGVWTESLDNRVVLKVREKFKKEGQSRSLTLKFSANIDEVQTSLELAVLINGQPIGETTINTAENQELTFDFPAEYLLQDDYDVLQINLPNVQSKLQLGLNKDQRKLGLMIEAIEIF